MEINNICDLHDLLLEENIDLHLVGTISFDDEVIKWEYDGFGKCDTDMEAHLQDVYDADKEVLFDFMVDNNIADYFFIHEPEFSDSFVITKISEE